MRRVAVRLKPHAAALCTASTFAWLHEQVDSMIRSEKRVGDLAIYDVAERIGHYAGVAPNLVYLHQGARVGARAVVPSLRGSTFSRDELPAPLRSLSAAELEDVLCIYKDRFIALTG